MASNGASGSGWVRNTRAGAWIYYDWPSDHICSNGRWAPRPLNADRNSLVNAISHHVTDPPPPGRPPIATQRDAAQQPQRSGPQPWVQEVVDTYKLEQRDLEGWLKSKFPRSQYGTDNFNVRVVNDKYTFRAPRLLSEREKTNEIGDLRWESDDEDG